MMFLPYELNSQMTLKNRLVMAPMTRAMAGQEGVPTQMMAEYYARRADAGLIVTEGTVISEKAVGFVGAPGIYSARQVEAWRRVTDLVHARGGLIFCQLWHVGRVSHPAFLDGELPVSASATRMTGRIARGNGLVYGESRAASVGEIAVIVQQFAEGARNAMAAGFDGVELHGANGYLIDQFLHYHTNLREDEFGGSAENMARFPLAVVRACGEAIGFGRVGLRLSPAGYLNEVVGDVRDAAVFQYLLSQLDEFCIAYVHTGNFDDSKTFAALGGWSMTQFLRSHYRGCLVACGGYGVDAAELALARGDFDLVAMGRAFIANPGLVGLMKGGLPLVTYEAGMLARLE